MPVPRSLLSPSTVEAMMKLCLALFPLLLTTGCSLLSCDGIASTPPTAEGDLAFVDVRVFDGRDLLEHQTVVVSGGSISALGAKDTVTVPADATTFEGADYTLLPGFIDAHVHLAFYAPAEVLRGGITTARDLAWPPDSIFPVAEQLAADPTLGPRLLAAGPMLTAPDGYPTRAGWAPPGTGLEVADADAGRAAVRDLATRGAAAIKLAQEPGAGPTLDLPVLQAIVSEAHTAGLNVSSHIGSLDQLELALEAGVDDFAHGLWSSESIPDATIERMVSQGVVVVPTLHIDPSSTRLDNLRRFFAAGGRVVYGTDMGNYGPPPGIDVFELEAMVSTGMTAAQALEAGTAAAADYLGLEDRGRVAVGLSADLVLVDGDPTVDLDVLAAPVMVMREGVVVR